MLNREPKLEDLIEARIERAEKHLDDLQGYVVGLSWMVKLSSTLDDDSKRTILSAVNRMIDGLEQIKKLPYIADVLDDTKESEA